MKWNRYFNLTLYMSKIVIMIRKLLYCKYQWVRRSYSYGLLIKSENLHIFRWVNICNTSFEIGMIYEIDTLHDRNSKLKCKESFFNYCGSFKNDNYKIFVIDNLMYVILTLSDLTFILRLFSTQITTLLGKIHYIDQIAFNFILFCKNGVSTDCLG